jgi:hypothetical protein
MENVKRRVKQSAMALLVALASYGASTPFNHLARIERIVGSYVGPCHALNHGVQCPNDEGQCPTTYTYNTCYTLPPPGYNPNSCYYNPPQVECQDPNFHCIWEPDWTCIYVIGV